MEHDPELQPGLAYVTVGTFDSSWRPALLRIALFGVGLPAFMVVAALSGGNEVDRVLVTIVALAAIGCTAYFSAAYRFWGVSRVTVTREDVIVERHGDPFDRIRRSELRRVSHIDYPEGWHLTGPQGKVPIRRYGFSTHTWETLSTAIEQWASAGPLSTQPGVLLDDSAPGSDRPAVFDAHYPPALKGAVPFCLLLIVAGIGSSWDSYSDGRWMLDPMMSIVCPLVGLVGCGALAWAWPKMVKRVVLLEQEMVVERFVGGALVVPYADIRDVSGERIRLRRGKLIIGQENSRAFHALIGPRLTESQQPPLPLEEISWALYLTLPMIMASALIGGTLGWYFDLNESQTLSCIVLLLIPCGLVAWGAARVLGGRDRRKMEKEYDRHIRRLP